MNKIKILLAMPIYNRELLALNSIRSIVEMTNIDKSFEVTLALGINNMDEMLDTFIIEYKEKSRIKIDVHKFGKNLGKGIAVNKLSSMYQFDYIISIDSDMICVDPDWLKKMVFVYYKYNQNPSKNRSDGSSRLLGSLCANQIGLNCHAISPKDPRRVELHVEDKFTLISHLAGDGVAGGVLMSDVNTWKRVKGYNGSKLYATDDGHYNRDCHINNRVVAYLKEVSFYHPFEFKDDYRLWKDKIVQEESKFVAYKTEQIEW